jgi:uncharacterized membrane protein YphA (DoxX/SURF4 family)
MSETVLDRSWSIMRATYGVVPIVAGADKFSNLLTDWKQYLSPLATRIVPVSPSTFMKAVGVIEMAAGALVLNRRSTRFGAYLVGAWLAGIALNLVTTKKYLDIAVRDLVMGIGAITLARLTRARAELQRSQVASDVRERERVVPEVQLRQATPEIEHRY